MLLTTIILSLTPTLQGPLPPQGAAPVRTPAHFRCLRVDNQDQASVGAMAHAEVFDFMTFTFDAHTDGRSSHAGNTIAHTANAAAAAVGSASCTSQLLSTAINITPTGRSTFVPQVTANLFGRLTSLNPDAIGMITAAWEVESLSASGSYQILPRPDFSSGIADMHYMLYAYCIGQETVDAFDPADMTTVSLTASNSNVLFTHLGLNAGWHLQATLQRSSSAAPNAAPEIIDIIVPETFNQAWVGTQAVPMGAGGGGTHFVSFNVSLANAHLMMAPNQTDAAETSIGGSASFHVRMP